MLIYTMLLGAIVLIAYLVQFQLYRNSRHVQLGTDYFETIGFSVENELKYDSTGEGHLAK